MKLFGALTRLTSLVFRKAATAFEATIRPDNITASRTFDVPDADTTLVGEATTQTLTNKTIDSDNNTITNIVDADIKAAAAIDAAKIANGTVDNTEFERLGAVTSAIVGETDTQTLTNKTLTSPSITTPTGIVKADVGLANVDNTSDANKPVSTATQTALDAKADETITVTGTGALENGGDLTANRTINVKDNATLPGAGGVVIPAGDTANRGASTAGRIRFNTEEVEFEGYNGVEWTGIGGGGLIPEVKDANFTAEDGRHYLITSNVTAVTLPTMTDVEVIAFSPVRTADWTAAPVTFTPGGSDTIEGDTPYEADISGVDEIKFMADFGVTNWEVITPLAPAVGGGGLAPEVQSASFNALTGKFYLIDTSAGDVTVTLPNIDTQTESIGIQVTDATNSVIVNADASDTIEGGTQFTLRNKNDWRILNAQSASNWYTYRASSGNGAEIGPWSASEATVITGASGNPGLGTVQESSQRWRRVGENAEIFFTYRQSTAGSNGSGEYFVQIPTSLSSIASIDNSKYTTSNANTSNALGYFVYNDNANGQVGTGVLVYDKGLSEIKVIKQAPQEGNGGVWVSGGTPTFNATAMEFSGSYTVAIAEWANSGTTVTLNDLTARTKCVDDSVLGIVAASSGLSTPVTGVTKVTAFAYRDSAGCYRINYNGAFTTASAGSARFRFGGTTFDTTLTSPVIANTPSGAAGSGNVEPGTNNIVLAGATGTTWQSSGDVLLDGKPSWFDANAENSQSIDAQVPEATDTVAGLLPSYEVFTGNAGGGYTSTDSIKIVKLGDVVTLSTTDGPMGHASASSVASSVIVPVSMRPAAQYKTVYGYGGSAALFEAAINTDGTISTRYDNGSGTPLFIANTGAGFSISWVV